MVVRRFDEVLSEKASKQNIKEVCTHLNQYTLAVDFSHHKQQVSEKMLDSHQKIKEVEETIDILGKNISKDIYQAVRRATGHLSKLQSGMGEGSTKDGATNTGLGSLASEEAR